MKSIRKFLLVSLVMAMLVVTSISCIYAYHASVHEIDEIFDAQLAQYARLIASHHLASKAEGGDGERFVIDKGFLSGGASAGHKYERRIVYQIWNDKGQLKGASGSASQSKPLGPYAEGFHKVVSQDGETWQVFSLHDTGSGHWYMAAELVAIREELVLAMARSTFFPVIAGTILLLLLVRIFLWRGLAPLQQISLAITKKNPDDLSPFSFPEIPEEVQELVNNINRLLGRMEVSLDRERRFSADVAHELKTPLAAIKLHIANAGSAASQEPALQAVLAKAEQGCTRLQGIVDQLLTLSRLEPLAMPRNRQRLDLVSLCREVLAQEASIALPRMQSIELQGDDQITVEGDAALLGILVRNLVHNAIVYTPVGGKICLTASKLADEISLVVADNGPGIPPAEQPKVFDRFYRVGGDNHASGTDGSGLGLSIVREVARLHGGRIALSGGLDGSGLAVSVFFPCSSLTIAHP